MRTLFNIFLLVTFVTTSISAGPQPGVSASVGVGYGAGRPIATGLDPFAYAIDNTVQKRHHISAQLGSAWSRHRSVRRFLSTQGEMKQLVYNQVAIIPTLGYTFGIGRWQFGATGMVPTYVTSTSINNQKSIDVAGVLDGVSIAYTVPGARKLTFALAGSLVNASVTLATYAQWALIDRGPNKLFYDMSWGLRAAGQPVQKSWGAFLNTAHGLRFEHGPVGIGFCYDADLGVVRIADGTIPTGQHQLVGSLFAKWRGISAKCSAGYLLNNSVFNRSANRLGFSAGLSYAF